MLVGQAPPSSEEMSMKAAYQEEETITILDRYGRLADAESE
jgi:hypothetical protein